MDNTGVPLVLRVICPLPVLCGQQLRGPAESMRAVGREMEGEGLALGKLLPVEVAHGMAEAVPPPTTALPAEAEAVGARGVGEGQRLGLGVRLGWAAGPLLHTVALGVASALPVSEAKGAAVVS